MKPNKSLLGLDVGGARIGVARAGSIARIPEALPAVSVNGEEVAAIQALVERHQIDVIVLGLPRSLEGNETDQTREIYSFAESLKKLELPLHFQDEAVTSKQAEAELKERKKPYSKGDIDSLAAVYILEDFLKGGYEV